MSKTKESTTTARYSGITFGMALANLIWLIGAWGTEDMPWMFWASVIVQTIFGFIGFLSNKQDKKQGLKQKAGKQ